MKRFFAGCKLNKIRMQSWQMKVVKLGSMLSKWVPTYNWGILRVYNPLILTFYQHLLGHPSSEISKVLQGGLGRVSPLVALAIPCKSKGTLIGIVAITNQLQGTSIKKLNVDI